MLPNRSRPIQPTLISLLLSLLLSFFKLKWLGYCDFDICIQRNIVRVSVAMVFITMHMALLTVHKSLSELFFVHQLRVVVKLRVGVVSINLV